MQIEYVVTGHRREVSEMIGRSLIASRIARPVDGPDQTYMTRDMVADQDISTRTGKPRRKYKTRAMQAKG